MSEPEPQQYDPAAHQRRMQGGQPSQGYAPYPPREAWQQRAPRRHRGLRIACLAVIGTAVIIVAVTVLASGGGGTTWKATVADYTVINPADLAVTVHVANTGTRAGTPTCKINAQDPSGAYSGFDEGTLTSPVRPGATATYVDNVTITSQGAQYVTQVTVSC